MQVARNFESCKHDCKMTWKLINTTIGRTTKKEQTYPPLFLSDGKVYDTPNKIVDGFNEFFANVGSKLADKIPQESTPCEAFLGTKCKNTFTFTRILPENLAKIINQIKPKLSCSIDQISNKLLKNISPKILTPLTHLFNLSLKTGYLHPLLKTSVIKPLFKSGLKNDFTNFRPISLISGVSKVLEKVVCNQLIDFFENNGLFYKHQYGFRKGHSTEHPIVHFAKLINNAFINNSDIISVFVDLRKAFDTVCFDILLKKTKTLWSSGDRTPLV